jgi:aromatic-amino-acid transaminase
MSFFSAVEMAPRDPILGLNEQFNADTNPNKVNLGVGVYFDDNGKLPLLGCVQTVEKQMTDAPKPRGYLPIDGVAAYDSAVKGLSLVLKANLSNLAEWPPFKVSVAPAA